MVGFRCGTGKLACLLALLGASVAAQQSIPDAPQPKNTQPGQFPDNAPPAPKNTRNDEPPAAVASSTPPAIQPQNAGELTTDLKQFGTIARVSVNFVQVPVIVRDNSGRLVPDLTQADFGVYEDGAPQKLIFFTSDPFPLSAAVVINTELPTGTMKKINETLPALIAAFSQYDEVALYRYGHTVTQVAGFSGAANVSTATLTRIKSPGRGGGPPAVFGPLAQGPSINGHPVNDPNAPGGSPGGVTPPFQESYVLNDAILKAAQDLSRRDRTRRKIIFVISDGREMGSVASFNEVRRVLLSNNIAVYALGVDQAAMPVYDKLGRVRFPGFGYQNILPQYVNDTGGHMSSEFDRQSIEQAYARITEVARNQYTLGYNTRATAGTAYRRIEVRVHRPNLSVYAKDGYYPLPPPPPTRP